MNFHKRNIFLILLNFLCLTMFVWFVISLVNTILLLGTESVFTNVISCLLFLVPYFCFILLSVLVFKNQHQASQENKFLVRCLLIAILVACFAIALFYLNSNISGLISSLDAVEGIKDGSIISSVHTQAQLLNLQSKLIIHNICLICSSSIFLISLIYPAAILFKKTK